MGKFYSGYPIKMEMAPTESPKVWHILSTSNIVDNNLIQIDLDLFYKIVFGVMVTPLCQFFAG